VLAVSVVICAGGEVRWEQLRAAIGSVLSQQPRPAEVLLVVDRDDNLAKRARQELTGVTILENRGVPGLSGARNTGLRAASQPITVFLDDDAEARPGWLRSLVQPYGSADVVATGGSVHPRWPRRLPRWLPPEFYWVTGGSYHGLPVSVAPARHPIGANMSMLTRRAVQVGGFDVGRAGARSPGRAVGDPGRAAGDRGRAAGDPGRAAGDPGRAAGDLAGRLTVGSASSAVFYVPSAAVDLPPGSARLTMSYFRRRCWQEGRSKARLVRLAGPSAGLERERRQVTVVIPAALLRNLRQSVTGDPAAFMRFTVLLAGLASAAAGYLTGRLRLG
jgi:hypothetical protein